MTDADGNTLRFGEPMPLELTSSVRHWSISQRL
jgi:hypothetical protein